MLYLFDVDGTLIRSFMRERFRDRYDEVKLLPNRAEKLARMARGRDAFGLVTNQGGVAFGYQTEDQVYLKMAKVLMAVRYFNSRPLSVHICFHHPKARVEQWKLDPCPRRKPGPGMIEEAMELHGYGPDDTLFVGDMDTDAQAAHMAGVGYQDAEDWFG